MELTHNDSSPIQTLNCPICNYKASCRCDNQTHIMTHADPIDRTLFKCFFCNHRVKTLLSLREHMFVHGDLSEEFKCSVCNVFCKSKDDFKDHLWLHRSFKKQETFECIYCDHNTYSMNSMRMHMLSHKNSIAVQECCLCHYTSKSKGDLLRHFLSHKESPDSDTFTCHICEYKTKRLSALRLHLPSHLDEIGVFKCCVCDYECQSKVELTKHFLIHKDYEISTKSDPFNCFFCNYITNHLADFRLHLLKHNKSLYSSKFCMCQYNCHLCDYKTKIERELELHFKDSHKNSSCTASIAKQHTNSNTRDANSHKAKKKFKCEKCSFSTHVRRNIIRHNESHKDRADRQLFNCRSCGASFTTERCMKLHALHHVTPQKRPLFRCDRCGYKTIYRKGLVRHFNKIHLKEVESQLKSKEKNLIYKCSKCSFKTNLYPSLKRHEDTHKNRAKRQLYECASCGSTYITKIRLEEHIFQHHMQSKVALDHSDKFEMESVPIKSEKDGKIKESDTCSSALNEEPSSAHLYRCDKCSYSTIHQKRFSQHQDIHKDRSERKLFGCASCDATFTFKTSLKRHTSLHAHPKKREFHREKCNFKTLCPRTLQEHNELKDRSVADTPSDSTKPKEKKANQHTPEKHVPFKKISDTNTGESIDEPPAPPKKVGKKVPKAKADKFQCDKCSFCTIGQSRMKNHAETHKDRSERKLFYCTICGATLTTKSGLKGHTYIHMSPNERPTFSCDQCEYKTIQKGHLYLHIQSQHLKGIDCLERTQKNKHIYQCEECPFSTMYQPRFKHHKETHKDRSERKPFECTKCGATYKTRRYLRQHSVLHMDPKDRPMFHCEWCTFKTLYKSCWYKHNKSNHKVKPESTGPTVKEVDGDKLDRNQENQHLGKGDPPEKRPILQCEQCEYKTLHKCTLNKHVRKVHSQGEMLESTESRAKKNKYQCKECSFGTKSIANLKRHESSHKDLSKRKLYECAICGARCTMKGNLKQHIFLFHMGANNRVKKLHKKKEMAQNRTVSDNGQINEAFIEPKEKPKKKLGHVWNEEKTETTLAEPNIDKKT